MRYTRLHKGSKTRSEAHHFRTRCIERLGFVPDEGLLVKLIQNHELELYDRQSNRLTRWIWKHNGKDYVLVYDGQRHKVVTILFKDLCVMDEPIEEVEDENEDELPTKSPEEIERLSRISITVS